MFRIKSLQRRLILFLVLPVAVFLAGMGAAGYFYIKDSLWQEWREAAILRLERDAHHLDMRLAEPKQLMHDLATARGHVALGHEKWVLQQLRQHPGVAQVTLTWTEAGRRKGKKSPAVRLARAAPPTFFYPPGQKLVGLRSELQDAAGRPLGQLEVLLKFDYLMADVLTTGWMQSFMACLVRKDGIYLAHSNPEMQAHCLGESHDPLELATLEAMKRQPFGTIIGPHEVIGFYRLHEAPWSVMLHAQSRQILAPILQFRFYYLGGALLCLMVILGLMRLGVGPLMFAIQRMSRKAAQVAWGDYGEPLPVNSADEMGRLIESFNEMMAGLKERDFIRNTFGRYVDEELAREILSRPEAARLGGEKREVVIFFSDIRNFTSLAESLSPEGLIHLVNRHFSRMIQVIQSRRGIIVDFLGDAILAFFDPLDGPMGPAVDRALRCALEMQRAVKELNAAAEGDFCPRLEMGIGLHAGEVVVGNIGSESRAKYGIMGSAVNLAHRIQGQAQGGEVVISQAVREHAPPGLTVSREFHTHLKGIAEPVTLYAAQGLGS
jgi:adenylate cyclase